MSREKVLVVQQQVLLYMARIFLKQLQLLQPAARMKGTC